MSQLSSRTVVKLGGSLLRTVDWPLKLRSWLDRQPIGEYYAIAGGGKLIDALRDLDQSHPLSQTEMHWRCIRALDATFEIAAELTPDFARISSNDELRTKTLGKEFEKKSLLYWVRIGAFYSPEFVEAIPLELQPSLGWETTSDSLALLLGSMIGAKRCVLFKACMARSFASLEQAVDAGIVDTESLRFLASIPLIELIQL